MLLGFKVKNYRSFKDLQRFSLIAGKTRSNIHHIKEINKKKYLRFSGIFGANGSGKSNLINAIVLVKDIINFGTTKIIDNQYYRGNVPLPNEKSYFEYELELNNKMYSYGYEMIIKNSQIVSEWLIQMDTKKENIIFERDTTKGIFNCSNDKNDTFRMCLEEMKNNTVELFLKEITRRVSLSNNNDSFFDDVKTIFKFFTNDMVVIKPNVHKFVDMDYFVNEKKIISILKQLDINITGFDKVEVGIDNIKSKLPDVEFQNIMNVINMQPIMMSNVPVKNITLSTRIGNALYSIEKNNGELKAFSLELQHANTKERFGTFDESNGTIRIFELLEALLSKDKLFIIDELDSSLHPKLVVGFIEYFLKNNLENQLIVTTHEMQTLNFDYIRRDEIWFTEKDENGASKLYSLEEFKKDTRFDKKISKAYMDGRYGAIANIKV